MAAAPPSNPSSEASAAPSQKYVPPYKRRQEGQQQQQQPQSQVFSRHQGWGDTPGSRNFGGDSGQNRSFTNFNRTESRGESGGGSRVAERWKDLGEDGGPLGGASGTGSMQSKTGTGWDIRGRRRWMEEEESLVFTKDKDKCTGINFDRYDSVPVDLTGSGKETIVPLDSFNDAAGVHPLLAANIKRVDYERPTPIQKFSIPVILAKRDLMACAQTGSGKTAAFLFPIITSMLMEGPPSERRPAGGAGGRMIGSSLGTMRAALPVALVLAPTRELAVQTFEESRKFCFNTGIRTVVVYGGAVSKNQISELYRGCDICVATPGRLGDLLNGKKISLECVSRFVLDEADRMLDMGFMPQIYSIVEDFQMPKSREGRQTVMFSATFPNQIQKLASAFLQDYLFLTVGRVGATSDCITQHLVYADEKAKPAKLLKILDEYAGKLVLVFVETKRKADLIERFLLSAEYPAVAIHGDKTQSDRHEALNQFRSGRRPILVATDVAARGLDIHNIEHVVNCDLPSKIDDYVHRIGRTGRAGNRGIATSFINEKNRNLLRDLLATLETSNQDIPQWFLSMVAECTSASRGFGSGNFSFGRAGLSRSGGSNNDLVRSGGSSANAFGGKDVRHGSTTTSLNNNSYPIRSKGNDDESDFVRPAGRPAPAAAFDNDDDEDGW